MRDSGCTRQPKDQLEASLALRDWQDMALINLERLSEIPSIFRAETLEFDGERDRRAVSVRGDNAISPVILYGSRQARNL